MYISLRAVAIALAMLLIAALVVPEARAQNSEDTFVAGEIVVQLVVAADLTAVATAYALAPTPLDQFGTRPIFRLRITDGASPPTKAAAMAGDPRIVAVEPNYLGQTPEGRAKSSWAGGGTTGNYVGQWSPTKIGLPEAHTRTRGDSVTVAVLDTGVDPTHPDLAGRLIGGYDFVDLDADPREQNPTGVAYGHGTHVAGLVALAAPDASIMPVRMLDPDGNGNLWVAIEALSYAVNPDGDLGTDDGADVINLSFSFLRRSTILETIVREVVCEDDDDGGDCGISGGRGAVVVAAAGNRASTTPEYPAAEAIRGVLAVAATNRSDALAGFSNRGPWVNISAPGAQIISSVPGGGYGTWSGTSMAAPPVAGSVALLRAYDSTLSPAAAAAQLIATGAPIAGAPPRLDIAAALRPTTNYTCRGNVVGTAVDNLTVPSGASCTLRNTRITGNLQIGTGASLVAKGVSVDGDVQTSSAKRVEVNNADVGGNVQIEKSRGVVRVTGNSVRGDVQIKENTAGVVVQSNRITGVLECVSNNPAPTGGNNQAKEFKGQCRTFNAALMHVFLPSVITMG